MVKASVDTNEFSSSAEARFQVTMVDACYYNELTCNDMPDIQHTISADGTSASPTLQSMITCTQTVTDNAGTAITCPLTQALETFNTATPAWEANTGQSKPTPSNSCTYQAADCQYEFDADNTGNAYDTLQPSISKRWVVNDARSKSNTSTVYVTFDVTIIWACYTDDITITAGGISTWEY